MCVRRYLMWGKQHCCCCCPAEIWDAIKAAVESPDMDTTRLLIDAAGVIVAKSNMTGVLTNTASTL